MPGGMEGFERLSRGPTTVLVRRGWAPHLGEDLLDGFARVPEPERRPLPHGRTAHFSYLPRGAPGRVFVRRASRGGLLRALLGDLYLGDRRVREEFRVAEAARAAGVAVPEPLGMAATRSAGPFVRLTVAMREIEGAASLQNLAGRVDPARKREILHGAADALRGLHAAGIYHADLTIRNILVAGPQVYVIDFDRGRLRGGRDVRDDVENLARLNRSIEKLPGLGGLITRTDKLRFLRRYLGGTEGLADFARRCAEGLWLHRLGWALGLR
jgi:3-deoxy-D-manno-octulosonic acid kinase